MIDATGLGLLRLPERPWSARAQHCSIKFTMAVWAARNGYKLCDGRWVKR